MRSVNALAKACGVSHVWMREVVSGIKPGYDTIDKIAKVTGVSAHWLRDGNPHDAPLWARDARLQAFDDMQEIARRLAAIGAERDAALARVAQLELQLRDAKDTIADMRIKQHVGARGRSAVLAAAEPELRYESDRAVGKGFEHE